MGPDTDTLFGRPATDKNQPPPFSVLFAYELIFFLFFPHTWYMGRMVLPLSSILVPTMDGFLLSCPMMDWHLKPSKDIEFGSRNVLDDMEIRQGIKDFTSWPTIPQVCTRLYGMG